MSEDMIKDMAAAENTTDILGVQYDEYGIPIPQEELELKDVTVEEIRDAINANDSPRGFCNCTTSLQLMRVKLRENPAEATKDDYEDIGGFLVKNFRADLYGFAPEICAINLTFDSPDDEGFRDVWTMLKRYREELENNTDREHYDYLLMLTIIPNKYDGRCFACFTQPLDFFRTINPDSDFIESTVHLIFSYRTVSFENKDSTQDEMVDYRMYTEQE